MTIHTWAEHQKVGYLTPSSLENGLKRTGTYGVTISCTLTRDEVAYPAYFDGTAFDPSAMMRMMKRMEHTFYNLALETQHGFQCRLRCQHPRFAPKLTSECPSAR